MKELRRIQANPDNSVLMVIDIDNEGDEPVGGLREPTPELSKKASVPVVRRLIDGAHEAGVQVIYMQSVRHRLLPQIAVFGRAQKRLIGTRSSEIVDELTPEPRDIVVRKWDHDPWFETDLARVLDGLVPDPTKCQVLITGGGITGCAFFGAVGFYIRNYPVVVVMDAVHSFPTVAASHWSRTNYPTYPNIYLTRSELIEFSKIPEPVTAGR